MKQYLELTNNILTNGQVKNNRTGIDTIGIVGAMLRFNLEEGFPVLTTKKMAIKAVVSELLWFLEGSQDERRLSELLHGSRDESYKTIWSENANAPYWKPKAEFDGDLGRVYGVQWRDWKKSEIVDYEFAEVLDNKSTLFRNATIKNTSVDQISNIVHSLKNNPSDRRMILTAWNVAEIDKMALPPCHILSQFHVVNGKLSCTMYQRSVDVGLGLPFNIMSYSLLTHMLAQSTGLKVGEFIWFGGDVHIYVNHIEQMKEQLTREPYPLPSLWINPFKKNIFDFELTDFQLVNYKHHPAIKMDMAV